MIIETSELLAFNRLLQKIGVEERRRGRIDRARRELDRLGELMKTDRLTEGQKYRISDLQKMIKKDDSRPSGLVPTALLSRHPHLLMPLGFDEFRVIRVDDFGNPYNYFPDVPEFYDLEFAFPHEIIYRESSSGAWYQVEGIDKYEWGDAPSETTVHLIGPRKTHKFVSVSEWMRHLQKLRHAPDEAVYRLLFPSLWTPAAQQAQRIILASVVPEIIRAIFDQKQRLRQIPWRRLEEIVAELLRAYGMEVWVTPSTRDGGRDVIARGELIPGEPSLLAVEVKQKETVGLADVQRAIHANQQFPILLLATAGTFSGGVVREKEKEAHALRLVLKDGIALRQWIDQYALRMRWTRSQEQNARRI